MNAMFERAQRWLRKPMAEKKIGLLRRFRLHYLRSMQLLGLANNRLFYVASQPDAFSDFGHHQEFNGLMRHWTAGDLANSGDVSRLWALILNTKQILKDGIPGSFAELGLYRGNSAAVLAHYAAQDGRQVYLFDTFEGFAERDMTGVDADKRPSFADTSIDVVKIVIGQPNSQACVFVKGFFPQSLEALHDDLRFAVVHIDCDLYAPMKAGLEYFYPRLSKGGALILHDYSSMHWDGARTAIDEFCKARGEYIVLMPDKSGSAILRKTKA